MSRTVTLVLVDAAGDHLGALPPVEVEFPWWQSAEDVVDAVRGRFDLDVTVLRLLHAERPAPPGGAVTYLAQVREAPAVRLTPAVVRLTDDPRRAAFARPGGPWESLRWAESALDATGRAPVTRARQQRTWNLSSIWRLETSAGVVWLKEVPGFFAHEPAVLEWLAASGHAERVPRMLASEGGRMLLDHVPGEDLYGAPHTVRNAIATEMHAIQVEAAGVAPELLHKGIPDRRPGTIGPLLTSVARSGAADPRLDALVAELPGRLARIDECGLPDTLVHGDLHPGNVRGTPGGQPVLVDWGDAVIGNPAFDILRLTEDLPPDEAQHLRDAWIRRWRESVPGSDPATAIELMRPVAALIYASVYAWFLEHIEPSEHAYHSGDVPAYLAIAAELFAGTSSDL